MKRCSVSSCGIRFLKLCLSLMMVSLMLSACGGGGGGGGAPAPTSSQNAQVVSCPASGTTNVTVLDFLFTPSTLTLPVDGIVKWTNSGVNTHTVTSGTGAADGKFDSGNVATNVSVCIKFLAVGSYPYFCTIHPSMTGSVTVQ